MQNDPESSNDDNTAQPVSPYQLQPSHTSDDAGSQRTSFEHESDAPVMDFSFSEVLYSASSFHAMIVPVSITMILAALAVVFINTEQTLQQGEQQLAEFYTYFKTDSSASSQQSTGTNLIYSIGNSFIIVSFIGGVTFLIVLLYKFRFMKCLIGYMILSSASLLGFIGMTVLDVAIEKYRIPIDVVTFYAFIINFAIVGIIAIFYQKGIPTYVTQGYLVLTSVILAWQLAHFDPWTTWTLLVFLALYDLCAVLSPCGPLKALVGLMQQDDAPDMPGLLYEAQLPPGAERRVRRTGNSSNSNGRRSNNTCDNNEDTSQTVTVSAPSSPTSNSKRSNNKSPSTPVRNSASNISNTSTVSQYSTPPTVTQISAQSISPERIIIVPFAIAKVYKLPLLSSLQQQDETISSPLLNEYEAREYTPAELNEKVQVVMPESGGRIEIMGSQSTPKYLIYDRSGELRRTLLVDRRGKVMQELSYDEEDEEDMRVSNSIKLGLGDFIFYSVLVAKAAMYSFTTFAACMLCILAGMGATLIILSIYKAALPALPISIFLAVIFYLLTRVIIEPWIEAVMTVPLYL